MKYSQFTELKEQLVEKGLSVKEFKNNPDVLNEVFGINKWLISTGIKSFYTKSLEEQAGNLKTDIQDTLSTSLSNYIKAKNDIKEQIANLDPESDVPRAAKRQIALLEEKILKTAADSIAKFSKLKTEQVDRKIDDSKRLKPSHKLALKYLWHKLKVDVEIEALTNLMKNKIVEGEDIAKHIEDRNEKRYSKLKSDGKKVAATVKDLRNKEKGDDKGNGTVASEKDPGPDKKQDTADDAIIDKEGDKDAESIDTKYLSEFTVAGVGGNKMKLKASPLYDKWKRIFNVEAVEGKLAEQLKEDHVVVFNKEKIKKGEQIRFDVYNFNSGQYVDNFVLNSPTHITDYQWAPDITGTEIQIPEPPDAIDEVDKLDGKDDVKDIVKEEKGWYVAKKTLDDNLTKVRELRKKNKGNDANMKKINDNFKEAMKKFGKSVNDKYDGEAKDKIIDYTESQIKGSAKSLWPEHKPPQSIISDKDVEITN